MDSVDASEHYQTESKEPPSSLLAIILDTNPNAWAYLAPTLSLSQAIANLLVFVNAHLAFNSANKVTIIASHVQHAEFLYPPSAGQSSINDSDDSDTEMTDSDRQNGTTNGHTSTTSDANFYRPFAVVSAALTASLTRLVSSTSPSDLSPDSPTTSLAGAVSLALSYINRVTISLSPSLLSTTITSSSTSKPMAPIISSRILVLSTSPAAPDQYIPLMNSIFCAQRLSIPIDVLALTPDSSPFLQQASATTAGIYLPLHEPHGFLQTLMQAFLPSPPSRNFLIPATQLSVDLRTTCFCHRKVVDIGYVCSICLSIFCEPPEEAVCLTCGTKLLLGSYGEKIAVVAKKKRKKGRRDEGSGMSALT